MKIFRAITILMLAAIPTFSQDVSGVTISPAISEATFKFARNKTAAGSFQIINHDVQSISVIIEPKTEHFLNGSPVIMPLPPEIAIKLDSASARIGPQQTYTFNYKITGMTQNTVIVFVVKVMRVARPHNDGTSVSGATNVTLAIPSVLYICDTHNCRNTILTQAGLSHQ